MAFIEKFEIDEVKLALKNPYTYVTFALFLAPLFAAQTAYNLYILIALAFVFAVVLMVDMKEYIIPDSAQILIFLLSIGLIETSVHQNYLLGFVGMGFAAFIFGSIYFVYDVILKKEALGFGDVKLFANVGLLLGFFGFNYFLWILCVMSVIFIAFRKFVLKAKNKMFPFGPFIVISAWICLLFAQYFEQLYINIMTSIVA